MPEERIPVISRWYFYYRQLSQQVCLSIHRHAESQVALLHEYISIWHCHCPPVPNETVTLGALKVKSSQGPKPAPSCVLHKPEMQKADCLKAPSPMPNPWASPPSFNHNPPKQLSMCCISKAKVKLKNKKIIIIYTFSPLPQMQSVRLCRWAWSIMLWFSTELPGCS